MIAEQTARMRPERRVANLWSLSALLIVRTLRTGKERLWWLVGIVWGVGLLNKPTVLLFILGVGFCFLVTRARVELLRKGYWLALAAAFVLFLPVLIWQAVHGWPFLRMMAASCEDEYEAMGFWLAYYSRGKMFLAQPAFLGPLNCVLVLVGVVRGLTSGRKSPHLVVLWACVLAGAAFVATSGMTYYMNPIYSVLLVFGCVATARITAKTGLRWVRSMLICGLAVQGIAVIPLCVPILTRDVLDDYSRLVCRGILAPLSATALVLKGDTDLDYWTAKLYFVYRTIPAAYREHCCIIVGYAPIAVGAEFYDARYRYHLPKIFSPHLSYAYWGPPGEDSRTVIAAYFSRKELERWFGRVQSAGEFERIQVYTCSSPKCTYKEMWKQMCAKDSGFRWKVDETVGQQQ